jgi:hypothetical protein
MDSDSASQGGLVRGTRAGTGPDTTSPICLLLRGRASTASVSSQPITASAESSLSRLDRGSADLGGLGQSWTESTLAMVHIAPPWAAVAVCWLLFARRTLKLAELAVAVALAETPSGLETHSGLDESRRSKMPTAVETLTPRP